MVKFTWRRGKWWELHREPRKREHNLFKIFHILFKHLWNSNLSWPCRIILTANFSKWLLLECWAELLDYAILVLSLAPGHLTIIHLNDLNLGLYYIFNYLRDRWLLISPGLMCPPSHWCSYTSSPGSLLYWTILQRNDSVWWRWLQTKGINQSSPCFSRHRHDAEYFWPEKEDMQGSTAEWPASVGGIQLALSQKGKQRSWTSLDII